jgi:hypothetical protein
MELWVILVMQLLEAYPFLECEKHPLTMCNCCLSCYIVLHHNSGILLMVFRELEKNATILAKRNIGCEKRLGGIGTEVTLHLCQILNSNEVQVGNPLHKSLSLSKVMQMYRRSHASY